MDTDKDSTFIDGVVGGVLSQRAGNRSSNVTATTANAFISWEFVNNWVLDGGFSHVAKCYQDAANSRVVPAYTLTDAGLRWQFS